MDTYTQKLYESAIEWKTKYNRVIIPVNENKIPLIEWGKLTSESQTLEDIQGYFTSLNVAYIGVVMGDGIVCIDVDRHTKDKDGRKSLDSWETDNDVLPSTYIEGTPRNGEHYYYLVEDSYKSTTDLLKGVDLLANKHYVIVSPSEGYTNNGKPIEKANETVLKLIERQKISNATIEENNDHDYDRDNVEESDGKIYEGTRTNTLVSMVGTLVNQGYSTNEIDNLITEMNKTECIPPLSDDELNTQVKPSIERFKDNRTQERINSFKGVTILNEWERVLRSLDEKHFYNYFWTSWDYQKHGIEPKEENMDSVMLTIWLSQKPYIDKNIESRIKRSRSQKNNKNAKK